MGKNKYNEKIEITAPVITQVSLVTDPSANYCSSLAFTSLKRTKLTHLRHKASMSKNWAPCMYGPVRQFSGFMLDSDVGEEAEALQASLAGSIWSTIIEIADPTSVYTVVQYN
ncbi:hypothetical protein HHK36_004949 [Tetracentron sinense]|uniref:Uncharacterized protein n=1 Tax=Tetracentron sinense TaxID=13715 RepID=A0A834ZNM0_TETSI|nr:hypothetical protein HHK36_004949 [Tetracentron sinense]